ncbi:phosphoglycerate kinase [Rhodothalassium salexigens]|uniref:phosphoglycerate kinase n=1 Tax=Rhodothalassium salexigens TaxID=1086 RepID=UPI0019130E30|nr:phosphoglycerate kinase [Rhodothalassium salexigens]MBK5912064.1 phosphoglycerate kinase [Rhodothalassium salexigens]MBK5921178.1 phosphoglycerate kinase [Rhodothalassium salexigens]
MSFRTIKDLGALDGKTVLLRTDLNAPMSDGRVTDDTRLRQAADSIRSLRAKGARVAVLSHFDRPKGRRVPEMSLKPLAEPLARLLGETVTFADDCVGEPAERALANGAQVVLLENVRFHPGEEANDAAFAQALAGLGHAFVNDAFSASHRAHASIAGIADHLPAAAGLGMEADVAALEKALTAPERPVGALVGGAKVSTKLAVLEHLVDKVDHLIIGGGMANTFLAARGVDVKASLCEHDLLDTARAIERAAEAAGCTLHLPVDAVVARAFKAHADSRTVPVDALDDGEMILDIGPTSVAALTAVLAEIRTLVWNGPLGAFEVPPFDAATNAVAQAAAARTEAGSLLSVAGGGDTVAALAHAGVKTAFSHVSTAGGAFLEWMEGRTLPGVAAIRV